MLVGGVSKHFYQIMMAVTVICMGEGAVYNTPSFSEESNLNHTPQLPEESVVTCYILALWLNSFLGKYVNYYRIRIFY